ncbi:PDDEXK nuclease domain-containing protein [Longimicrobium sp.]|uniref:PDDEXK nuclease domain-containing protein n=1 Tax=Longimicrobium sp. TaxID=2029185 RepID=UPI002E30B8A3|nr:PDDEXK nuclease domain-containing protein [Longimicrobium sp.]HEX6039580.1 PDDEXK nuclease domain-containing protein [Longimicrobium sp.]
MPSRPKRGAVAVVPPSADTGAAEYGELLDVVRERIRSARVRAAAALNRELVTLYWQIGHEILTRQQASGWGARVVERLADDLRREFPDIRGLSRTNLMYTRAFAEAYPDEHLVEQVMGHIPWGHNTLLLDKVDGLEERVWYARQALEHGWSRNVLVHQVESGLYERRGQAVTNFHRTLPPAQSDLAVELIKDPYKFFFTGMDHGVEERELERALLAHVRDFLLELGVGFALVGSQYRLEVGGQDYRLDLLFYHIRLKCYVVVDLKVGAFKPEYAGKMNFYLSALDDRLRQEGDGPSIGLVLCKERNRVVAEYAVRGIASPIGVAEYRLMEDLPARFKDSLPSPEQLQSELTTTKPDGTEEG